MNVFSPNFWLLGRTHKVSSDPNGSKFDLTPIVRGGITRLVEDR